MPPAAHAAASAGGGARTIGSALQRNRRCAARRAGRRKRRRLERTREVGQFVALTGGIMTTGLNILITANAHDRRHSSPQNKATRTERPGEPEVGLPLFCSSIRAGS